MDFGEKRNFPLSKQSLCRPWNPVRWNRVPLVLDLGARWRWVVSIRPRSLYYRECMDGWMGGWVAGWMGGWMDGWVAGWVDWSKRNWNKGMRKIRKEGREARIIMARENLRWVWNRKKIMRVECKGGREEAGSRQQASHAQRQCSAVLITTALPVRQIAFRAISV